MNPEIKAKWLTALRSGEYKQGVGYLRQADNTYCCLGVLADIAVKEGVCEAPFLKSDSLVPHWTYDGMSGDLSVELERWSGISGNSTQVNLMTMNDDDGYSFDAIADWIEENL